MADDSPPPLHRLLEALLFVGGPPLTRERAAEAVRGLTREQFAEAVGQLAQSYREQGRPYRVSPRGGGHELVLRPGFRERLRGSAREARLSQPALDTLSLVAFKQPVTRQEVDNLRGADSLTMLRQLVRLGLVCVQRTLGEQEPAYSTTPRFLQMMGVNSLDDLPRPE
ncbi:MAG: SMC-Scp complex subunit ScpB [Gemmataceae bacterium]|nr:SMC-Scp complex subunit ScpB [Gemmataceae bacterium]